MLDARHAGSSVRAAVVVSAIALGVALGVAACATGGGEGGPSAFTSTDPPIVLPGGDAASTSAQSSTAMPDGCPDVSETSIATGNDDALDGASQDEPEAVDESPLGDDAAAPDADDDGPSSTVATLPPLPVPGDLVITEIMAQPSGPEPESEWFEIYNQSSYPVLLSGVTVEDGYLDTQVIASNPVLVAQPGEYLLLVRSRPGAAAALLPSAAIVYAYGVGIPDDEGIELDAGPFGELALLNGQTVLADVPYGQWGVPTPGQSLELGTSATTQSDPSGWCIAQNPWAPGSDDGTPGAASDCP
jgi:Lamin Tail Domain